jgi:hypothetical protein
MKYLITETQSQKFLNALVKVIDAKNYDGLCKLEVDDEPDEDGKFWVYAVFSKKWLDEYPYSSNGGAVKEVNKTRKEIRQKIKEYFDTEVILGSYFVDKCESE